MNFTHDSAQQQRLNPEDYANRSQLKELLFNSPIPKEEILLNIGLYLDRRMLSRFLFVQEMYTTQLKLAWFNFRIWRALWSEFSFTYFASRNL
jgi:hypothetical protein